MSRRRVAIVQEYVPQYRVKFFAGLVDELAKTGIDCVVVAGHPAGTQALRGDAVDQTNWMRLAEPRRLRLGQRAIHFYGTDRHWRDTDGVIIEFRGTSLDLNRELMLKRRTGRRVGVWGHIKPFTQPGHPIDLCIERRQMRRSDHVFAYTQSGSEYAIASGVQSQRVTTVMNSLDVGMLVSEFGSVQPSDVRDFQGRHGLKSGKTFGYIGGLDASKRIDFLSEVMDLVWQKDSEVKLLIGGRGDQEGLLAPAVERGQVVPLGYVDARAKALIARTSQALINPGRVGLLAVECMAIGLPILTTDWEFHAPEYEYLEKGVDVFLSPDDVHRFADLMLEATAGEGTYSPHQVSRYPTIDDMIRNFASGVTAMMA